MTDELMTLDDIANTWKCNRRHARDVITKLVGFPDPAPGATRYRPCWLTAEVRDFLHRKPAKMQTNPEYA
jgi:hypothetical protein